jgi:hypothetical protein
MVLSTKGKLMAIEMTCVFTMGGQVFWGVFGSPEMADRAVNEFIGRNNLWTFEEFLFVQTPLGKLID